MAIRLAKITRQVLFCAATGLGLCAESPRLGVELLGSWPTGSMRPDITDVAGVGIGAFADWEVDAGRTIRLAYEGIYYPNEQDTRSLPGLAESGVVATDNHRKSRSNSLTLQYRYFPGQDSEGFYFMAGLGAMNYFQKIDTTLASSSSTPAFNITPYTESGIKLACVAGMGYEFNKNWGLSAKYSFITVNNRTLGAVQTGLSYRF